MSKQKLLALKGLPASGKSTAAKLLEAQGWVRTNKDTIRAEMFPNYSRKDEKKVVRERNRQILEAIYNKKNVVVDDTNLNPVHIKELSNIARQNGVDFEVDDSFLDVPLWECIERDSKREGSARVGEQVIRSMYHQYIKTPKTALKYDPSLPMAIICDIDGTLAHMVNRSPFDWHKVGSDVVDEGVAHLLDAVGYINYATVFLFSGRDEVCRPETEEWLERHDIDYHELYMRRSDHKDENGNQVNDRIVKREMLEKYIIGKYNVLFVVDDRPSVCRMWRDEFGLKVLQAGDPHYEF